VTADQLEMISTDPRVMHGQAVIAGTRVPVSVILDCLAAGMTAEEITAEYPTVTVAGVRAAAAYGAAVWATGYIVLPEGGLYKPIWEYDAKTLAWDLSAHLAYGASTGTVFWLFVKSW